jgi:pimeloyl-ACP methyl ester carboxylesterase
MMIKNFPTPKMIAVNGVELEVFEAGEHNRGNPIALCHGWPEHAFSWRHQVPVLVEAGYHVIVPNQRGFGRSSCPNEVTQYDIAHLTDDLVALLAHYNYDDAVFVGHDWGANIVWSLAQLHPQRVKKIINMALPYQPRTEVPWIAFLEQLMGADYYMVHFNRQPGVADAVLDDNVGKFLQNIFRKNVPPAPPAPSNMMIDLALSEEPQGDPLMSAEELAVYVDAFRQTGFTPSINYYRNMDRNWHLLADVDPIITTPALMIYGARDVVPPLPNLSDFVPNVSVATIDAGHSLQQEKPEETNKAMLDWLAQS